MQVTRSPEPVPRRAVVLGAVGALAALAGSVFAGAAPVTVAALGLAAGALGAVAMAARRPPQGSSGRVHVLGRGSAAERAEAAEAHRPTVTFADVAGLDEVLGDLRELVDFIRNRDRYLALDARLPRGVLLYGPPGTGKTLIARALAGEAGATFRYASGSSFVEKYVGVGAQRIRELFQDARKHAPAVVFVDEIDTIGRRRGSAETAEWDSALNQLLTELDGFNSTDNVLFVAATNRRELLDEALLRPGRLDRQIYIGLPDLAARLEILRTHTRRKPLAPDVDLEALARRTSGLSGAHLAAIVNEAALCAVRAGRPAVTAQDLATAFDRVLAGQSGRTSVLSDEERRLVAYHEAGHAVAGWVLGQGAIERISLLPRSRALGYVLQVPEERALVTRSQLEARIAVLLAGRAAEALLTGDFTTGAADDLQKVTELAERMVCQYGMGERRPHQVIREEALVLSGPAADEVDAIVRRGWVRAQEIVGSHRQALAALATALLEREVLDRADVEAILGGAGQAA
ncbi:ATP-dependent metallopeptidase FtsH/Yme1/Tma family protein [Caldinitratiruptor microaerophilus]|uniref:ATP-dependent zinc metalloprotease FtsH n=1 Tax=Caldinitratiruptor microaerophilus TaxID=671077 RepID=A0AA35CNC3_9FIRM|nr:AAA family ATPase [Caldinitratiruptor microaerophilus]BDG60747.1 ATP-dependent zinc metalloprotease FtsH [Caldinitratiruptor microaerophilus]